MLNSQVYFVVVILVSVVALLTFSCLTFIIIMVLNLQAQLTEEHIINTVCQIFNVALKVRISSFCLNFQLLCYLWIG